MHKDTAATAADWLPYRARQSFNLFELAALLRRQDPERLLSAVLREQHERNQELDRGREFEKPAMILGMVQAMPEAMLGDDVGELLRRLQKALGVQSLQAPLSLEQAQSLASLFGLEWPPELRAAGAHPMGRFEEGRAAATTPTEAAPASASKRKRLDTVQVEIDDLIAGMESQGEPATAAKVMARLRERAGQPDSCISECAPDGVIWIRGTTGTPEKLTTEALKKRISRT